METLAAVTGGDAGALVDHVFAAVESFVQGALRSDDSTCLALVYRAR